MINIVSFSLQKQLGTTLHKSQQRIDQRIKKWQDLRQAVESVKVSVHVVIFLYSNSMYFLFFYFYFFTIFAFYKLFSMHRRQHSAQTALEENERIFSELLLSIERKYNEVKEMIRRQESTTVMRGEILLDRMEEEITLLRKKHNDLDKLSHTDDHIHFLQARLRRAQDQINDLRQRFQSLCVTFSLLCCYSPELAVTVRTLRI